MNLASLSLFWYLLENNPPTPLHKGEPSFRFKKRHWLYVRSRGDTLSGLIYKTPVVEGICRSPSVRNVCECGELIDTRAPRISS